MVFYQKKLFLLAICQLPIYYVNKTFILAVINRFTVLIISAGQQLH